jgi:hypothetical protein
MLLAGAVLAEPAIDGAAPFKPDKKKIAREVAQGFEPPPQFSARKLLPKLCCLSKAAYTLDDLVINDGAMNHFTLRTRFGDFYPGSEALLLKRMYEAGVREELEEFTDTKVFIDAAAKAGKDVLLAPIRGVETLLDAVTDPEETWETIKKAPGGVINLISGVFEKVDKGVSTGKQAVVGTNEEKKEAKERISDGAETATNYALKHFGYNRSDRVRKWQEKLMIDPYTSNQPLQEKIARIAAIENGVSIGVKFVPGVGGISLVSDLNRYYKWAKRLSLYDDPVELAKKRVDQLKALGIENDTIKAFTTNPRLSPTSQAFILDAIEKLPGVDGREWLVVAASQVASAEAAVFYVNTYQQLAAAHLKQAPFARVLSGSRLPAAVTKKGRVVVPLAVDYLTWSKDLAGAVNDLIKISGRSSRAIEVRVSGGVSKACLEVLRSRGLLVRARYLLPPLE